MSYLFSVPKERLACPNHPKYSPSTELTYRASCAACAAIYRAANEFNLIFLPALRQARQEIAHAKELRAIHRANRQAGKPKE